MSKLKAGIVGAAGYTGGELIRILMNHPNVEVIYTSSRSQAGKLVAAVHDDLIGQTNLVFSDDYNIDVDVVFICLPHGHSRDFLQKVTLPSETIIIDLSNDFRLQPDAGEFIYGLPELNKNDIKVANKIANPGCFATAIQLALLPLAANNLLTDEIHISAITGSTGAGVKPSSTTHFTWRNNNMSVYKAFQHQHLGEIKQSITQLQPGFKEAVNFIPYRGDFTRGIIATVYTDFNKSEEEAYALYGRFYNNAPFVNLSKENIHLKQVVNTNNNLLHLEAHDGKLMIISVLDNLLKGASGQAVQNLNIRRGWPEDLGLKLKAVMF